MEWLSSYADPWLLIVDNIGDVNGLRNVLPGGDSGHILVTARNIPDYETARSLYLSGMGIEDAQELLLRATQRMKPWSSSDLEGATAIIGELRGKSLPHTLIQIAATVRCGFCSQWDYVELFRKSLQTSVEKFPNLSNTQQDAIAALEIALAQMKEQELISSKDATKLAHVFPFFQCWECLA